MESNPYLPPRSRADATSSGSVLQLGRAYRVANTVYAALLFAGTGLLLAAGPLPLDRRSASVFLYFYAPVACYFMLRWSTPAVARWFLGAYGLYLLYLFGVFAWNLGSASPDVGIGMLVVGINLVALVSALLQMRRAAA
ncbi:hypothetical protein [Lysobacter arvi]|uniref:DUF2069 domain-containing protein n=1 Tax=Lysobacter arvi TaxID=3038776 RepID=A0ABU1CGK9_9GAMM|nr:hypothetical protein [Lysobacter arvi]MDR0184095.1 hypothetical protein [Lysobacter arvi]